MDDDLLSMLGRSLWSLTKHADALDEVLVPRQASSGENAGKPPARRGSKPPVVLGLVDFKAGVEDMLGQWCGHLVAACPEVGPAPTDRSIAVRAEWIRERLPELEAMPWAQMCAEQIIAQERMVADVVEPPASTADPEPIKHGTAREVESWARHLGVEVSRSTIRRWIDSGAIASETLPDGRVIVRLADVLDHKREQEGPQALPLGPLRGLS